MRVCGFPDTGLGSTESKVILPIMIFIMKADSGI